MSKTSVNDETVAHLMSVASLFHDGVEAIKGLLRLDDFSGVSIAKRGATYHIEGRTEEECRRIRRAYIAAFPGSLSKELERKNDDLRQINMWLNDGYTLLLIDLGDFVRAYRYVPV